MKNKELKAARENGGLTQKQVAEKVDILEQVYQRYEYGAEPRVKTAIRIARVLNSTVEKLFDNNVKESD